MNKSNSKDDCCGKTPKISEKVFKPISDTQLRDCCKVVFNAEMRLLEAEVKIIEELAKAAPDHICDAKWLKAAANKECCTAELLNSLRLCCCPSKRMDGNGGPGDGNGDGDPPGGGNGDGDDDEPEEDDGELSPEERMEIASRPWYPSSGTGPTIPPTTPVHPTAPPQEIWVPAGTEGSNSFGHNHLIPAYINGWCTYVWIVRSRGGVAPVAGTGNVPQGQVLTTPPQETMDAVAEHMQKANEILKQCNIALRVCGVNILDTTMIQFMDLNDNDRRKPLSDAFTNTGTLNMDDNNPVNFLDALRSILTNEVGAFRDALNKECVHLFFVSDVEDRSDQAHEAGIGGSFTYGPRKVSYATIDAGGSMVGNTIAHEVAHAVGHNGHAEDSTDAATSGDDTNLMQEVPGIDDTSLQPSQCSLMSQ